MAIVAAVACGPGAATPASSSGSSGGEEDTTRGPTTTGTTDEPTGATGGSTGTSNDSTSTGVIDPTTADSSSSSTGADGCRIGGAERCVLPGYDGPGECDPYQQDCPAGQKCLPYDPDAQGVWDSTRCTTVVAEPAGLGERCTMTAGPATGGEDTCDHGLVCWDLVGDSGTCAELCGCGDASPTCETQDNVCAVLHGGAVGVCRPTCIPTDLDTCGSNQVCVFTPAGIFQCLNALENAGVGEPCDASNACGPGLACSSSPACTTAACCVAFCDTEDPASCEGTCTAVFPSGAPHECYDALGVCSEQ